MSNVYCIINSLQIANVIVDNPNSTNYCPNYLQMATKKGCRKESTAQRV